MLFHTSARLAAICFAASALGACTAHQDTAKPTLSAVESTQSVRAEAKGAPLGKGTASFYGRGRRTASGEPFRPHELTAAHRSLPFGTLVSVTNVSNGRSVVVRINDRGPAAWTGRVIDVSTGAARVLGMVRSGTAPVVLSRIPLLPADASRPDGQKVAAKASMSSSESASASNTPAESALLVATNP